ncbi:HdeD family acid-resistance protein [Lacticaseibacillus daqingensis]|uniref:HdeD family acid-resistance protein n=1 Tax=Lacticaseibacillus daqingensis TaxID=2486014 RepID=UPI000F79653A|nr:DUF308 domain-containing protein [Lacticaseibacillus daqingensis]
MFNRQTHFGFDWGEFITGVALIIAAIVMFRNPGATMLALTFIFAILAIVRGIATLDGFPKLHELTGKLAWLSAVAGVLDLLLGVVFLFNLVSAMVTLAYLLAAWFLIDAIANLFNAGHLRRAGAGWFILNLVLDLFAVLVGVLLLMQPVVAAVGLVTLLAIAFVIFGLNAIVMAFARQNI